MTAIRAYGRTYDVRLVPHLELMLPQRAGVSEHEKCIIEVARVASPEVRDDTLIHEMLHIVDVNTQLGLEEKQVHAIATGLYMLLKDNGFLTFPDWWEEMRGRDT